MENGKYKKGNFYYYKSVYMNDALKVKLIDKQEWDSGEIESLTFEKQDKSVFMIKKYELKYVSLEKPVVDGYTFEVEFNSFIYSQIEESAGQSYGLIKIIDDKLTKGEFSLTFVEEVKDGRSRRFNENKPLALKNQAFSYKGVTLKINNINLIGTTEQESDYNEYFNSNYLVSVSVSYGDKMKDGGLSFNCIN